MSEKKRYTIDELMPKRYPENEPRKVDKDKRWVVDKYNRCYSYIWDGDHDFETGCWDDNVLWFLDIPGAPEEVRPRKYPDEKPEKDGKYIIHRYMDIYGERKDEWARASWRVSCGESDGWDHHIVDYFIPYALEEEKMELPEGKLDKIMSLEAKYAIGGGIKYTRNAMTTPLGDEQIADFADRFMAPYCNGYDFNITKRAPEIAPCPFCGGECQMWSEDFNQVRCTMKDNCGYRARKANSIEGALKNHNLIAGKGK